MKLKTKLVFFNRAVNVANQTRQSIAVAGAGETIGTPGGFGALMVKDLEIIPPGLLVTSNVGIELIPWVNIDSCKQVERTDDDGDAKALQAKIAELEAENLELKTRPEKSKRG